MMRLVVVALLWCTARADEYGAGMPLYGDNAEYASVPLTGSAVLDYRGHSPDAPAPFDYKYEEERQGNTEKSTMDTVETDLWKKPARKQRGQRHNRDDPLDSEVDVEPLPKLKSNRRNYPRHRSRVADEPARRPHDELVRRLHDDPTRRLHEESARRVQDEPTRRRRGRHGRSREDADSTISVEYLDKADYRVDKNDIVDDVDTFTLRVTTERIIRRKPRDRLFSNYVKPLKSDDLDLEEDLMMDRKMKSEPSMDRASGERERPLMTRDPPRFRLGLPGDTDLEEDDVIDRSQPKSKSYNEYDEYYDMKRLRNYKNKLPMLFRKTTTPPSASPAASTTTMADLLQNLWTMRRRVGGAEATISTGGRYSISLTPPTRSEPRVTSEHVPATETTTTTPTITTPTTTITNQPDSSTELSIAEKSRLSILKKSQKKENDRSDASKKPPVLLQVTKKVQTVVLVEQPTSVNPWMRAKHIMKESPANLEKVKRMMRHKLVAGAKSIQDLTDHWDDMVCDYVDVSLLNFGNTLKTTSVTLLYLVLVILW